MGVRLGRLVHKKGVGVVQGEVVGWEYNGVGLWGRDMFEEEGRRWVGARLVVWLGGVGFVLGMR